MGSANTDEVDHHAKQGVDEPDAAFLAGVIVGKTSLKRSAKSRKMNTKQTFFPDLSMGYPRAIIPENQAFFRYIRLIFKVKSEIYTLFKGVQKKVAIGNSKHSSKC